MPLSLSISSYSLNVGYEQIGVSSLAQTVTVSNASSHTVTFSSVTFSGDLCRNRSLHGHAESGPDVQITVVFTPTVAGTRSGAVTLKDNSPGSPTPVISLTGVGEVYAHLVFAQQPYLPGPAGRQLSRKPLSAILVNDGTVPVNITGISVVPADGIPPRPTTARRRSASIRVARCMWCLVHPTSSPTPRQ